MPKTQSMNECSPKLTLVEIVLVVGIVGLLLVGVSAAAAAATGELRSQSRKLVHDCKNEG